jgi:hypothetical protein
MGTEKNKPGHRMGYQAGRKTSADNSRKLREDESSMHDSALNDDYTASPEVEDYASPEHDIETAVSKLSIREHYDLKLDPEDLTITMSREGTEQVTRF